MSDRRSELPDAANELPPVPWTAAYLVRRDKVLRACVTDLELLKLFSARSRLPAGYGIGVDERCVEYPWVLAHVSDGPGRLLDAGATLNYDFLLSLAALRRKQIHCLTLAPESDWVWHRGPSYVFEDLRHLPLRDGIYETVVCLSTLEHVGCDNSFYTDQPIAKDARPMDFVVVARELWRVLKPGGVLLLTVPYGTYQFHGAFQQFDRDHLTRLVDALGPNATLSETFYRYCQTGWQLASSNDCSSCEYVSWVAEVMRSGHWPEAPRLEADYAANARAVACVRAVKPG
jgi:hypothetical protein